MTDITDRDQKPHLFRPGQSGNPKGRPKGARSKLGEAFLENLLADWQQYGAAAIVEVRETKPDQYLKVVASILPKELELGDDLAGVIEIVKRVIVDPRAATD